MIISNHTRAQIASLIPANMKRAIVYNTDRVQVFEIPERPLERYARGLWEEFPPAGPLVLDHAADEKYLNCDGNLLSSAPANRIQAFEVLMFWLRAQSRQQSVLILTLPLRSSFSIINVYLEFYLNDIDPIIIACANAWIDTMLGISAAGAYYGFTSIFGFDTSTEHCYFGTFEMQIAEYTSHELVQMLHIIWLGALAFGHLSARALETYPDFLLGRVQDMDSDEREWAVKILKMTRYLTTNGCTANDLKYFLIDEWHDKYEGEKYIRDDYINDEAKLARWESRKRTIRAKIR